MSLYTYLFKHLKASNDVMIISWSPFGTFPGQVSSPFLKPQKPSSVVLAVWKCQSPPLSDKAERVKTITVLSVYFVLPQKVFFFPPPFVNLVTHRLASINMVKCRVCLRHPHFHQNSERPDVISLSGVHTHRKSTHPEFQICAGFLHK